MNLFTSNSEEKGLSKLAKKLIFLFVGFLIFYSVISYIYRTNLKTSLDLFAEKIEPIKQRKLKIQTLFLGDSHPGGDILNRFLPKGFYNLGFPNHNLTDQLLLLKWAHNLHPELKYVVLQADFHIFAKKAAHRDSPKWSMTFADYRAIKQVYNLSYFELFKEMSYYHFPLLNPRRRFSLPKFFYYYGRMLLSGRKVINQERYRLDRYNDLIYKKKFQWNRASRSRKQYAAQERIHLQFGKKGPYLLQEMIESFKKIKSYTRRNDLKIIYIRYPVTKFYRQKLPLSEEDRKQFRKILMTDNSVLRLNFSAVFDNRTRFFRNSDHLNYDGAVALTNLFVEGFRKNLGREAVHQ